MIGVVIGDLSGSRYERNNHRSKDFDLFDKRCRCTDDTIMSLAICEALLKSQLKIEELGPQAIISMQRWGRRYPRCGFGRAFARWVKMEDPQPYNSYGNGAAMRVSGCGYAGRTLEEVKFLSKAVTEVTHNHPEGLKGAEAVATAVFLAHTGKSKDEIKAYITKEYYFLDFNIEDIRSFYRFNSSCQGSVPQALQAFFESTGFEDTIRTAISIGGDSDTIAAIAGAIAEAYYGVPRDLREQAMTYLDEKLIEILKEFEKKYP